MFLINPVLAFSLKYWLSQGPASPCGIEALWFFYPYNYSKYQIPKNGAFCYFFFILTTL